MEFLEYARSKYINHKFHSAEQFISDLDRVRLIKRLFTTYKKSSKINSKLVLNNIIILTNQFGILPANNLMFYRIDNEFHGIIKAFLLFIDSYVDNEYIDTSIKLDTNILENIKGELK